MGNVLYVAIAKEILFNIMISIYPLQIYTADG